MMKQGVSLPYLYNLFPSKNSHLDCCIHHLSYAHLGKTSLREAHILPDDNLFPLSEVFCVWGASEVENEGDNCGQGYQEVPEPRGHCQVFGSPTEEPHHLRLFSHYCSSISAKTMDKRL